jgi:hypothetical protein
MACLSPLAAIATSSSGVELDRSLEGNVSAAVGTGVCSARTGTSTTCVAGGFSVVGAAGVASGVPDAVSVAGGFATVGAAGVASGLADAVSAAAGGSLAACDAFRFCSSRIAPLSPLAAMAISSPVFALDRSSGFSDEVDAAPCGSRLSTALAAGRALTRVTSGTSIIAALFE